MKREITAVFACVGSIVGAGFASGREVMLFFTQYGVHGWWLILLASVGIGWLCSLCIQAGKESGDWTELFGQNKRWALLVSILLMAVTAGAMIAAAGWLASLVWASEWAYALGSVGTLGLAWMMSGRSLKMIGWISALLSILLIGVLVFALCQPYDHSVANIDVGSKNLLIAALKALAYAAMNMMLAIGVVSRCRGRWVAVGTGSAVALLLCLSHLLYRRYPQLVDAEFPVVALLQHSGRQGYAISAGLLYLSVFTTLTAVVYALRSAAEKHGSNPYGAYALAMGLPLAISCAGFSGVVNRLYAIAGLICFATVFLPLCLRRRRQTNT